MIGLQTDHIEDPIIGIDVMELIKVIKVEVEAMEHHVLLRHTGDSMVGLIMQINGF